MLCHQMYFLIFRYVQTNFCILSIKRCVTSEAIWHSAKGIFPFLFNSNDSTNDPFLKMSFGFYSAASAFPFLFCYFACWKRHFWFIQYVNSAHTQLIYLNPDVDTVLCSKYDNIQKKFCAPWHSIISKKKK